MKTINVRLKERSYQIKIAAQSMDNAGELARLALGTRTKNAIIVSNPTVEALYGKRLSHSFKQAGFQVSRFLIGDGELPLQHPWFASGYIKARKEKHECAEGLVVPVVCL